MSGKNQTTDERPGDPLITAVELTEKNFEKNRYSCIKLSFDSWLTRTGELTSRVTYTRRYDLDAEFDSISNYFRISDTVVNGCRALIKDRRLLEDFPPKRSRRKPGSYSEIRVFSGKKVVSRLVRQDAPPAEKTGAGKDADGRAALIGEIFEELERLLKRTLG